jgi:hypothetical protein
MLDLLGVLLAAFLWHLIARANETGDIINSRQRV